MPQLAIEPSFEGQLQEMNDRYSALEAENAALRAVVAKQQVSIEDLSKEHTKRAEECVVLRVELARRVRGSDEARRANKD